VTSGRAIIPEIDGLRFVAIMSVVFFHMGTFVRTKAGLDSATQESVLESLLGIGHYGVQLFFAISGFILTLPFAESRQRGTAVPRLRVYMLRRVTRLEPPYLINLLLVTGALCLAFGQKFWDILPHLGASAFYLHNVIYGRGSDINNVAWTLEIEVQFYLLVPIFAQIFRIRSMGIRRAIMIVLWCLGTLVGAACEGRWQLTLVCQLPYFWTGVLLTDLTISRGDSSTRMPLFWDAIGLLGWLLAILVCIQDTYVPYLLAPCVLTAYLGALRGTVSSRIFKVPLLTTIGGACYTIYLYHYLIISALGRYSLRYWHSDSFLFMLVVQTAILVPAMLGISLTLFAIAERPFMDKTWPSRTHSWWKRLISIHPSSNR